MLNPDEVSRLIKQLSEATDQSKLAYEHGFRIASVVIGQQHANETLYEEHPNNLSAPMRRPDFVLGTPIDSSCLSGVDERQFSQPPHSVYRYTNARVAGWRTVISAEGELFCGWPISTQADFERLQKIARSGFEGCVPLSLGGQTTLVFRCAPRDLHIAGTGLFLGMLEPSNYGSFLFRGLPQMLLVGELPLDIQFIIVGERTPWAIEALAALGFENIPTYSVREVYGCVFEQLIVISEIDNEGFFDEISLQRLRRFAARCATRAPVDRERGKIYVSRALSVARAPSYRVLVNESEIEDTARSCGYRVVYPEVGRLAEQCVTFLDATSIMGPSGSGMLNAVFAPHGVSAVDLEVFHYTVRQHAKVYSSTGKAYGFIFGNSLTNDPLRRAFGPWRLDPALVYQAVDLIA
jgi:hypothetical protein